MREIESLGYVGVRSDKLDDWQDYCPRMLGMQVADRTADQLLLRMDGHKQRLIVCRENGPQVAFLGWQVRDNVALEKLAARLDAADVAVSRGSAALAAQRNVAGLIVFEDPLGNRNEVFFGPACDDRPFIAGRTISGFRTGALGMGHAVLHVARIDDVLPFYRDLLGFGVSDFAERPLKAWFLHVNARHHSLALIETGTNGLHHLMIELGCLDDVGQGLDIALHEGHVGVTLGRHYNDWMTSFYTRTPSDFLVEYGWGGRMIEPNGWEPEELTRGYSLWGHERDWFGPAEREEARLLRMKAACEGIRQPVQVMAGNYQIMVDPLPSAPSGFSG